MPHLWTPVQVGFHDDSRPNRLPGMRAGSRGQRTHEPPRILREVPASAQDWPGDTMIALKLIISWPGRLPQSCVQVWHQRACKEDIEGIIKALDIAAQSWPTRAEVQIFWSCRNCEWEGREEDRVAIFQKGQTGCPQCGGECAPLLPINSLKEAP